MATLVLEKVDFQKKIVPDINKAISYWQNYNLLSQLHCEIHIQAIR